MREPRSNDGRDERHTPTGARELFRYRKDDRIRSYQLKALPGRSAEIWVMTDGGGHQEKSRRLMTLTDPEDTAPVLESIEQDLRTSGWSRV